MAVTIAGKKKRKKGKKNRGADFSRRVVGQAKRRARPNRRGKASRTKAGRSSD